MRQLPKQAAIEVLDMVRQMRARLDMVESIVKSAMVGVPNHEVGLMSSVDLMEIVSTVGCDAYRIPMSTIRSRSRLAYVFECRMVISWMIREIRPNYSLSLIAEFMGGKHHGTIIHELKKARDLREVDKAFEKRTDELLMKARARLEEFRAGASVDTGSDSITHLGTFVSPEHSDTENTEPDVAVFPYENSIEPPIACEPRIC